jgi:hypothetical protein
MNVFTCSIIVLCIKILLLSGTCSLNVSILDSSGDIFIPKCFAVLYKEYNALCNSSSETETKVPGHWSSANSSVLITVICFSFTCLHVK